MTAVIFKCPNCAYIITHEIGMWLAGVGKSYSDSVPVSTAHAIEGDEIECDRCRKVFTATVPPVAKTVEVTLTPVGEEAVWWTV